MLYTWHLSQEYKPTCRRFSQFALPVTWWTWAWTIPAAKWIRPNFSTMWPCAPGYASSVGKWHRPEASHRFRLEASLCSCAHLHRYSCVFWWTETESPRVIATMDPLTHGFFFAKKWSDFGDFNWFNWFGLLRTHWIPSWFGCEARWSGLISDASKTWHFGFA